MNNYCTPTIFYRFSIITYIKFPFYFSFLYQKKQIAPDSSLFVRKNPGQPRDQFSIVYMSETVEYHQPSNHRYNLFKHYGCKPFISQPEPTSCKDNALGQITTHNKTHKSTQSYQIGIQQITFYFINLICENLCCLRYLRAFETALSRGLLLFFLKPPGIHSIVMGYFAVHLVGLRRFHVFHKLSRYTRPQRIRWNLGFA